MKKVLRLVAVVVLVGLGWFFYNRALIGAGRVLDAADGETVKIGVILPLSGNNAKLGQEGKQGVEMAIEDVKVSKKYEFIFEDDQKDPKKTVAAANKLIKVDGVKAIINYSSQSAAILSPIVSENNVRQFAFSSDTEFTKLKGNYAYSTPIKVDAEVLLKHFQKMGYKKVAMIAELDGYYPLFGDWFKKLAPEYGLEIVSDFVVNPSDRDFKMIFSQTEERKPDVYVLNAWMPIVGILTKQLREVNSSMPVTSAYAFAMVDDMSIYEGQFFVNFGYDDTGFDGKFNEKFGANPALMSAVYYSMSEFLLRTFDRTDNINDEEEFRKNLEAVIAEGKNLMQGMSLEDNLIAFPSVLMIVKDGKMEMIK